MKSLFLRRAALGATACAAALTLGSCNFGVEEVGSETPSGRRTVRAVACPPADTDTRVSFSAGGSGSYSVLWDEYEEFMIAEFVDNSLSRNNNDVRTSEFSTVDGRTATFEFSLVTDWLGDSYKYCVASPYESVKGFYDEDDAGSVVFSMPASQVQYAAGSPDPKAVLMLGHSDEMEEQPEELFVQFSHVAAYGHLKIANLAMDEKERVVKVSFAASDCVLAGDFEYIWDSDDYGVTADPVSEIAVDMSAAGDGSDVWFATMPAEGVGRFSVSVTTDCEGVVRSYRKEVAVPEGRELNFRAGRVTLFGVDMSGVAADGSDATDNTKLPSENSVAYVIGANGIGTTAGAAPDGSSARYVQSSGDCGTLPYNGVGTLTLSGYAGKKIKTVYFMLRADAGRPVTTMFMIGENAMPTVATVSDSEFSEVKISGSKTISDDEFTITLKNNTSDAVLYIRSIAIEFE